MHTFKNFKNFADVEIDLSKPMTLLIGRNGSGKSNLVEGVELLSELIKGRLIEEISDLNRGNKFEIRGNLQGCIRKNEGQCQIGFKDTRSIHNKKESIEYIVDLELTSYLSLSKQLLSDGQVLYSNNMQKIDYGAMIVTGLGAFVGLNSPKLLGSGENAYKFKEDIFFEYAETHVFDFHPHIMRAYENKAQVILTKNGSNISATLYYLSQKQSDILQNILDRIKEFPEESFIKFEFTLTPDDVIFALKYPNGEVISAKLLSDGTLRALAILTALETVPEGSRVIIEEIDNGIHASRTKVLLDAIWETSHRRNLKTLITTHNSATLDGLNDEQLEGVVICHYDKETQSAKLTPFFDLPHVDILLQKGKLGGLVTRNVIEHYLDPKFEQKRQAKMQSWLESIE